MTTAPTNTAAANEVVILSRVLSNGKEPLTPALARYFLGLGFGPEDKARMHELAVRNQGGTLSAVEKDELVGYAKAGCLLGILQSRARKLLKKSGAKKGAKQAHG
jgi:hypothetical protein